MTVDPASDETLDFCYLTTTGRRSGRPHRIEIWFAVRDGRLYLLAGGGEQSDWVRNLRAHPDVELELGDQAGRARARVVGPEEEEIQGAARPLLAAKYQRWRPGDPLSSWARDALLVELEPDG